MKKVLLALGLVAVMASSAFAGVSLQTIGLLATAQPPYANALSAAPGALSATALSFDLTDDISMAVGLNFQSGSPATGTDPSNMAIYLNGMMNLMKSGPIGQLIGLELGYASSTPDGGDATTVMQLNVVYRVAVDVAAGLTLLVDVEGLTYLSADTGGSANSALVLLNGGKVGLSVPIM